jgi:hypothetical protein
MIKTETKDLSHSSFAYYRSFFFFFQINILEKLENKGLLSSVHQVALPLYFSLVLQY